MPTDQRRGTSKRETARRRIEEKRATETAARARARHRQRTVVGRVVAGILLVVAVVVVIAVQSSRTETSAEAPVPAGVVDGGTGIAVGDSAAPVTLEIYEDFQCPACAQFEATSSDALARLVTSGQARVVYHPIAFLDRASTTEYSTRALNAAAVVLDEAGVDAYLQFHDLLFADQPAEGTAGLTDGQLVDYAAQSGATGNAVENGIRDRVFEDWTKEVTDASSRAGITGTPTVLVDGEPLDMSRLTPDGLTAAVEAAQAG